MFKVLALLTVVSVFPPGQPFPSECPPPPSQCVYAISIEVDFSLPAFVEFLENLAVTMFSYKSYIPHVTQAHVKTTVIGMALTTGKRPFLRKIEEGIQIIVEV